MIIRFRRALLHYKDGEMAEEEALLAQWDPYNIPILSEKKGTIAFEDMLPGVTTKVERMLREEGPWS